MVYDLFKVLLNLILLRIFVNTFIKEIGLKVFVVVVSLSSFGIRVIRTSQDEFLFYFLSILWTTLTCIGINFSSKVW
jgi:hypothetical protein